MGVIRHAVKFGAGLGAEEIMPGSFASTKICPKRHNKATKAKTRPFGSNP